MAPPNTNKYYLCTDGEQKHQARSQAWANPGSARVAQKTARVAQIVKMYEIDILTLEKAL